MAAVRVIRFLRRLLDVDDSSIAAGKMLQVDVDGQTHVYVDPPGGGGGGGAPTDANYLVGTANVTLSNEIVVGPTPGGELGNTWAAPTVDATHSGSSHASVQAAAEATAAAALAAHVAVDVIDGDAAGGVLDGTYPNPGIAASVAGSGLAETANVLSVNVDDSTLEISADTIRVKASGITATEIAVNAVGSSELADDAVDTNAIQAGAVTAAKVAADVATQAELDDHSARHENGGGDEISIAGLDGTSVELAAHLADATDAHDASAVSVDSTALSGTAITVQGSLEELDNLLDDHSARHENGGADEISIAGLDGTSTELAAHLADASDAHDASAISVLDTNGDYTATDVEGVLAEIAPQLGGSNGIVATGTNTTDTSISATTEATANVIVTASAFTADGTSTYWIDFFCVYISNNGSQFPMSFYVYEGSGSVGQAGVFYPTSGDLNSFSFRAPVTPAAGSRTYSVRASVTTGSVTVKAGAGGSGNIMPASITVTK